MNVTHDVPKALPITYIETVKLSFGKQDKF